jgi:hypothetical protein
MNYVVLWPACTKKILNGFYGAPLKLESRARRRSRHATVIRLFQGQPFTEDVEVTLLKTNFRNLFMGNYNGG